MVAVALANIINPLCWINSCVEQVAGLLDNNPVVHYDACTSAFGAPATSTYTVDSLVFTATTTLSSTITDEVWNTVTNWETTTTTAWTTVNDAATVTSTIFVTETVTMTASNQQSLPVKRRHAPVEKKKRGACKPRSSTASSSVAESTTSSGLPIPSNCANREEFSSACSCITAVSDAYVMVAVTEATSTGTITATETALFSATSTITDTVIDTTTVAELATTTVFTTTETELVTSKTTTTTTVGY
ncbi:hypothetical protein VTJ49DRAFT_7241 [Mycothermus thermophilus]|uniref:Uncharacterized protein n=1 Tax=Humicola insolens TaxID=85995 RepID=A0ABR3VHT4_HUMIN